MEREGDRNLFHKVIDVFRKVIDVFCFAVGPALMVVSLLSLEHRYPYRRHFSDGPPQSGWYEYSDTALLGIGLGVALLCIGFLRRHWRKREK